MRVGQRWRYEGGAEVEIRGWGRGGDIKGEAEVEILRVG